MVYFFVWSRSLLKKNVYESKEKRKKNPFADFINLFIHFFFFVKSPNLLILSASHRTKCVRYGATWVVGVCVCFFLCFPRHHLRRHSPALFDAVLCSLNHLRTARCRISENRLMLFNASRCLSNKVRRNRRAIHWVRRMIAELRRKKEMKKRRERKNTQY